MSDTSEPSDSWAAFWDMTAWARWLSGGLDAGWGPWIADTAGWRPAPELPRIQDADAFVDARSRSAADAGVWETARERLLRTTPGRAPWGLGFLHGFGASRGGGEAVLDPLAADIGANIYYPRLPGHGSTPDAHASAEAERYLQVASETLALTRAIGERTCLVGSSTGGLLATWLAARWPDDVDALVLASPFYAFADPSSLVLRLPFGLDAVEWAYGPDRDASFDDPRALEGYSDAWLTEQRTRALGHIERLRGWLARDDVYARVRCPVLLLYHPADQVVSVSAMHYAFARFAPHPASRFVPIDDGNHVLLSAHVASDKDTIDREFRAFFEDLS